MRFFQPVAKKTKEVCILMKQRENAQKTRIFPQNFFFQKKPNRLFPTHAKPKSGFLLLHPIAHVVKPNNFPRKIQGNLHAFYNTPRAAIDLRLVTAEFFKTAVELFLRGKRRNHKRISKQLIMNQKEEEQIVNNCYTCT